MGARPVHACNIPFLPGAVGAGTAQSHSARAGPKATRSLLLFCVRIAHGDRPVAVTSPSVSFKNGRACQAGVQPLHTSQILRSDAGKWETLGEKARSRDAFFRFSGRGRKVMRAHFFSGPDGVTQVERDPDKSISKAPLPGYRGACLPLLCTGMYVVRHHFRQTVSYASGGGSAATVSEEYFWQEDTPTPSQVQPRFQLPPFQKPPKFRTLGTGKNFQPLRCPCACKPPS